MGHVIDLKGYRPFPTPPKRSSHIRRFTLYGIVGCACALSLIVALTLFALKPSGGRVMRGETEDGYFNPDDINRLLDEEDDPALTPQEIDDGGAALMRKRVRHLLKVRASVADDVTALGVRRGDLQTELRSLNARIAEVRDELQTSGESLRVLEERLAQARFRSADKRLVDGGAQSTDEINTEIMLWQAAILKASQMLPPVNSNRVQAGPEPNRNEGEKGENLGWRGCDMNTCFDAARCAVLPGLTMDIYDVASPAYLSLLTAYLRATTPLPEPSVQNFLPDLHRIVDLLTTASPDLKVGPREAGPAPCLRFLVLPLSYTNTSSVSPSPDPSLIRTLRNALSTLRDWSPHGANYVILFVPSSAAASGESTLAAHSHPLVYVGAAFERAIVVRNAFPHYLPLRAAFDVVAYLSPPISVSPSILDVANVDHVNEQLFPSLVPIVNEAECHVIFPDFVPEAWFHADDQVDASHVIRFAISSIRSLAATFPRTYRVERVGYGVTWQGLARLATFTLIVPALYNGPGVGGGMGGGTLVDHVIATLTSGSIPLILASDQTWRSRALPYSEYLDWDKVLVEYPLNRVNELHYIVRYNLLKAEPDLFALKKAGRDLRDAYFTFPTDAMGRTNATTTTPSYYPLRSPTSALTNNFRALLSVFHQRLRIPFRPDLPVPARFHSVRVERDLPPLVEHLEYLGPIEGAERGGTAASEPYCRNFTSLSLDRYAIWNEPSRRLGLSPADTPWDPVFPCDAKFKGSNYGFRPINYGYGGAGKEFSLSLGGNYPKEQFTIVMPTYKRADMLKHFLTEFNDLPYLNRIIVIWNEVENPPPENLTLPNIHVPIYVLKVDKNSLNNRFIPYDVIETDAVLSLDDDLSLRHDEIIFAFRVWRESRDRLVGFPARYHAWNATSQLWHYKSNHTCEYSMILTGAAFIHKYFFYKYTYDMANIIRDKVDEWMNCEDIAMNFLMAHITNKPPIKVTVRWTFRCKDCPESLWYGTDHYDKRSHCINYFSQIYGYNPLMYSQYRADSVLFKTRIPKEERKCFVYV